MFPYVAHGGVKGLLAFDVETHEAVDMGVTQSAGGGPRPSNPFADGGAGYARHRPTYPRRLADVLADSCPRTHHALDVGCGTGQLSGLLARRFERVTATDPSPAQLAHAQPCPGVTYVEEPAERIGLDDASVDLVVAAQAAHWFNLDAFYAEARRVARPGAPLALISYGVPTLEGAAGARLHAFYWTDIHPFWPTGREHVERGYQSLPFPFNEIALPPLSIDRDWRLPDLLGYLRTWSAVRRATEMGQGACVDAGLQDLADLWGHPGASRRITWPIVGRLARLGA